MNSEHIPTENAFTACANGKDSDQPVHLQYIYMANSNVLLFMITYESSFFFDQCCVWTLNMAIHMLYRMSKCCITLHCICKF